MKILTFGEKKIIKSIFKQWVISFFKQIIKKKRFIMISAPIFQNQYIYDRYSNKLSLLKIKSISDWYTIYQVFIKEDYKLDDLSRYSDLILFYKNIIRDKKIPIIFDCGGNIGITTKYFSIIYPAAKIICIEPDKNNIYMAIENNLNQPNIEFIHSAVGSAEGIGKIIDPGLGNNAYRIKKSELDSGGENLVKILSINNKLKQIDSNSFVPFYMKIDIEGYEDELFSKNYEWIERFPIIAIELHDWMLKKSASSRNFLIAISSFNRDFINIGENIFSISNQVSK